MDLKPKNRLLKDKTAVIISTTDTLAIHLGEVISEHGMSVHISSIDLSEEAKNYLKNQSTHKNVREDFVLIYIRESSN